jgi:hypothetical protein
VDGIRYRVGRQSDNCQAAAVRGADHLVAGRPRPGAASAQLARRLAPLRFLLLFSPRSLFLYPGFGLFVVGCLAMAWLLPQPRLLGGVGFDVHTLLYASLAVVVGFQSMMFWVFAKVYGMRERIVPPDPWFGSLMSVVTLEAGLIIDAALLLGGLGLAVYALGTWGAEGFGALAYAKTMRLVIPSSTAILLGFEIIYSAFFVSILEIRASRPAEGSAPDRSIEAA